MDRIRISKIDETEIRIDSELSILHEVNDYFTFDVPGAKFMPLYKAGYWDGKKRLFSTKKKSLYHGLLSNVVKFAHDRNYEVDIEFEHVSEEIPDDYAKEMAKYYNLKFMPKDYQNDTILDAIRTGRGLWLSPTASGKSYIIYQICKHSSLHRRRVLIIVPTVGLVAQMRDDFADYNPTDKMTVGTHRDDMTDVVVTTWQSIHRQPLAYFSKYDAIIGDEAHHFQAKSLEKIITNCPHIKFRYGFTGTIDDTATHRLVLQGMFGPIRKVISTRELMDRGDVAQLKIKCVMMQYTDKSRLELRDILKNKKGNKKQNKYADEMSYIFTHEKRNKAIVNLTKVLKGNTLVLFNKIEHGQWLKTMMEKAGLNVYYIDGGVKGEERNKIRKEIEEQDDAVLIASYGTTSTGINIVKLNNIVFAAPYKSKIKNLQSLGRGLRKGGEKNELTLYDICDVLKRGKQENYAMQHFKERLKIYTSEGFKYKLYPIILKD